MSRKKTTNDDRTYLAVTNVTGTAEERGYRLFWFSCDGKTAVPEQGYATSSPFRTEADARSYAKRKYGVSPVRVAPFRRGPNRCKTKTR